VHLRKVAVLLAASIVAASCAPSGSVDPGRTAGTGGAAAAGGASGGTSGAAGAAGNSSTGTAGAAGAATGVAGATGGTTGTAGSGAVGTGGAAGTNTGGSRGGATGAGAAGMGGRGGGIAGTGGASGAAGSGGATGTLTLTGLTIDANPNMTISCFVSWTTAAAATSEVDFGEGSYQFRIRDAAMVTAHKVLVIGMHAQKAYKIKAVSTNAQGTGSAEGTFMTGQLPASVPLPMLSVSDFANSQVGWTLTNIMPAKSGPANAVMYDQNGVPVWYYIHGTAADSRGDVSTDLIGNTVIVGPTSGEPARDVDLSGKVIWTGPAQTNAKLATHFVGKTSAGNYLLNIELDKTITNGSTKIDDQLLEEITPTGSVVWMWKLFDHIKPAGTREELSHGNSLTIDDATGVFYYNCRFVGMFKVDRATGNILWRMGGSYDTTSLGSGDFTYDPTAGRFSDAHDPEIHSDGTILFYDNGGYAGLTGGTSNYHSRVLEYQIDEAKKTAKVVWEFPGTFAVDAWYKNTWYSPYWGDADRLDNGNILITAPTKSASASTRIFEVTRAGKVVWEIIMPVNNGSFRAQRLAPPPLVEPLP
jgi:hypothetical protein